MLPLPGGTGDAGTDRLLRLQGSSWSKTFASPEGFALSDACGRR